ncbi:uncharacterized protein LOC128857183 [Anastrepha ludens]|uniref:uncharacterized protein LOC128857183 n=1 Tax=Anastrepha ludens TaxID=28586 RepID=UPI0023B18C5A|nr:uncharacterized protein LOC128857183 [Anastrepha ludens]
MLLVVQIIATCIVVVSTSATCATSGQNFAAAEKNSIQATNSFLYEFKIVLQRLQDEIHYNNVLLLARVAKDCVAEELLSHISNPHLIHNGSNDFYVKDKFNREFLSILCLDKITYHELLRELSTNLQHMRTKPILAILNRKSSETKSEELEDFFMLCEKLKLLNVIILASDFHVAHIYHSYTQFPVFEMERKHIHIDQPLMPYRLLDLRLKRIWVLLDRMEPNSMLYHDPKVEQLHATGYIGRLFIYFMEHYRCILQLPGEYEWSYLNSIHWTEIYTAARNGTIDFGFTGSKPQLDGNMDNHIYPLEMVHWLTMLPVEQPIKTNIIIFAFFRLHLILLLLLICWTLSVLLKLEGILKKFKHLTIRMLLWNMWACNFNILRGILSQSPKVHRNSYHTTFCYALSIYTGFIFTAMYSNMLVNWLTVLPHEPPIRSFDGVVERKLLIQVYEKDLQEYRGDAFFSKYQSIFKHIQTYAEFQHNRRQMDTRYGYTIDAKSWLAFKERQNHFARPLFRLSSELYYAHNMFVSFPVFENSIYKDLLDRFCLHLREAGIIDYYHGMSYYDSLEATGYIMTDPSKRPTTKALKVVDFIWLWVLYATGIGISALVFLMEQFKLRILEN